MFEALFQRIVALFLAFVSTLSASSVIRWRDSMEGHEFPVIPPTEKAADDVRVMSFNVRCADNNGVPRLLRSSLVIGEIRKIAPDSFGVQEATPGWIAEMKAALDDYACVSYARDNGRDVGGIGESCAVFFLKEKYELLEQGNFWISSTPEKPSFGPGAGCRRVCTWVLLKNRGTGAVYAHVNTHLDNKSGEARELGASMITSFIEEKFAGTSVVFTADLNSGKSGGAYRIMAEKLTDASAAAADSVSFGSFHECSPETTAYTLDYVMCSPDVRVNVFRVVTDGVDGRFVSDHFPLYADVRFGGENQPD